jgi:hypothetical protein
MGTLHALLPLVPLLQKRFSEPIQLLAWNHLIPSEIAGQNGVQLFSDFRQFQESISEPCSFLLTGTSEKSLEDSELWQWAETKKIPSFAFVDQWSNIAVRFEKAKSAPGHIFAIDSWCAAEIKKLELPSKIHVVGTPLWDMLNDIRRGNIRSKEAVFVTEPVSARPLKEHLEIHGYQDLDSLEWALDALNLWLENTGEKISLKIKLHPRDSAERVESWLNAHRSKIDVQITEDNKQKILSEAEFVFGDRSMLLVEASLVGAPVVSFQPGRKSESPATDREGLEVVTDKTQILSAMKKAQLNKPHLPRISSSEQIVKILEQEVL